MASYHPPSATVWSRSTARPPMTNVLISRLRMLTSLSDDELLSIEELCASSSVVPANADIVPEGQGTDHLHVVLEGWACRYVLLGDGRRQIPALYLPGDFCDLDGLLLRRVHYGVAALTKCVVAKLPHDRLRVLMEQNRAVRDVLWWMTFLENGVSTEWSVGLGRRSTQERLAHLLCELLARLSLVDLANNGGYVLPVTQEELGDILGVSTVHVNRTLQELRSRRLIDLKEHRLTIPDPEALRRLGGFSPDYLHMEGFRAPTAGADQH